MMIKKDCKHYDNGKTAPREYGAFCGIKRCPIEEVNCEECKRYGEKYTFDGKLTLWERNGEFYICDETGWKVATCNTKFDAKEIVKRCNEYSEMLDTVEELTEANQSMAGIERYLQNEKAVLVEALKKVIDIAYSLMPTGMDLPEYIFDYGKEIAKAQELIEKEEYSLQGYKKSKREGE